MVLSFQADTDSIVSGCVEQLPQPTGPRTGGFLGMVCRAHPTASVRPHTEKGIPSAHYDRHQPE